MKMETYIHSQLIGQHGNIPSPLYNTTASSTTTAEQEEQTITRRPPLVYADYTASGRSLKWIEQYIQEQVLPYYGNTHTTSSQCGYQSTHFREEARRITHDFVGGNDHDRVFFCGSGATASVHTLVHAMGVRDRALEAEYDVQIQTSEEESQMLQQLPVSEKQVMVDGDRNMRGERPIVFVGPYVHHSNLLPWREAGAKLVMIPEDPERGGADLKVLESELIKSWYTAQLYDEETAMTLDARKDIAQRARTMDETIRRWTAEFEQQTKTEFSVVPQIQRKRKRELYTVLSKSRRLRIGAFSAASNITGALNPVDTITALLHTYGAFAVWDYAAAAPHMPVIMNPVDRTPTFGIEFTDETSSNRSYDMDKNNERDIFIDWERQRIGHKDAVFFSPHKFVGGPSTAGVLVAKKYTLISNSPSTPGGGTIFFVHSDGYPRYTEVDEDREEGGTPDIISCIRTGLVLHLQNNGVGYPTILSREQEMLRLAKNRWKQHPNILVHAADSDQCVSIVSFEVLEPDATITLPTSKRRRLHWNYVATLCNDVFGIQCRGGCLCAGPYAIRLLGLSDSEAESLENCLLHKEELLRPGFVRVAFPYHMTQDEFQYIIEAIEWIANYGCELMPLYVPYPDTGEWKHRSVRQHPRPRSWLQLISFSKGKAAWPQDPASIKSPFVANKTTEQQTKYPHQYSTLSFDKVFEAANDILKDLRNEFAIRNTRAQQGKFGADETLGLRHNDEHARLSVHLSAGAPVSESSLGILSDEAKKLRWFMLPCDLSTDETTRPGADQSSRSNGEVKLSLSKPAHQYSETLPSAPRSSSFQNLGAFLEDNDEAKNKREESEDLETAAGKKSVRSYTLEEQTNKKVKRNDDSIMPSLASYLSKVETKAKEVPRTPKNCDMNKPPKKMMRMLTRGIRAYRMISDGDRVMVALSGGKDSLSMLHMLFAYRAWSKTKFEIEAMTVDPQAPGFDPSPLKDYLRKLGVKYHFESQPVIDTAKKHMTNDSICAWCSRMKRGIMYSVCRREKCNVLAMGQHLDDLAESFVMSVFYNGILRTMKASYWNQERDIKIVRPMVHIRERDLAAFAEQAGFPVITDNCPACFNAPTERERIKDLLATQEHKVPQLFSSLLAAMKPLMALSEADDRGIAGASKKRKSAATDSKPTEQQELSTETETGDDVDAAAAANSHREKVDNRSD